MRIHGIPLGLSLLLAMSVQTMASTWVVQTVDTGIVGEFSSLQLDSTGLPHVSYIKMNKPNPVNGDLRYAYFDGASWHTETVMSSGDVGWYNSLALDSQDRAHIAHCGFDTRDLYYTSWNGSSWQTQIVDNVSAICSSLILDSSDMPQISYLGQQGLTLAYSNNGPWQIEAVDTSSRAGWNSDIAVDSDGNTHIIYEDHVYGNSSEWYAYNDGNSWSITRLGDAERANWGNGSIVIDDQNVPHVSYMDSNGFVKYGVLTDSGWAIETVCDDWYALEKIELALDSKGNPAVAYETGDGFRYSTRSPDGTWTYETVMTDGYGLPSMQFDANDNPWISFQDGNMNLVVAHMVPEPAILSLLALSGLAMLRRRK